MRITTPVLALTTTLALAACGGTPNTGAPDTSAGATSAADASAATDTPATQSPAASPSGSAGAAQAPAAECPPAEGTDERITEFAAPPPMCIDPAKQYTATIATDAGEFQVALDSQQAPKTVNNFVFLARHHFYDTTPFHRVIQDFMIQGGDPQGTGMGGPGYTIEDEFPKEGAYEVGSVAMANTGQPNSGGSQFFVITGETGTSLPSAYALFGTVTNGMDTVQKIEADGAAADDPTGQGVPQTVHTIEEVTITEE